MKARVETLQLNQEVDKLRRTLAIEGTSQNNTSTSSLLPSEFKEVWKELVSSKLVDALSNYYDRQYVFVLLTQSIFKIAIQKAKEVLQDKLNGITKHLNLPHNNEEVKAMEAKISRVIFQDYMKLIFHCDETFISKIRADLVSEIKTSFKHLLTVEDYESLVCSEDEELTEHEDLIETLGSAEFASFISVLYDVCIYMILTDPPLVLNLCEMHEAKKDALSQTGLNSPQQAAVFKYLRFDKTKCECVDGFPVENKLCLLVVEAPKKSNSNFL